MSIHPTALISPKARIGRDCVFGPFCVIEDDVEIGDGCVFEAHSIVKSGTVMGSENHVFEGAVIGGHPQCLGLACSKGKAVIGDRNLFRENCTVHRSKEDDGVTQIGSDNMLMVNVHVAHDCRIGDRVLISNNTMLAGHVDGTPEEVFQKPDVSTIKLEPGHKYLFNIGSIGQPRNRDPRASFAVYDSGAMTVSRYRLPYDILATQAKVIAAGLPERLAVRLALGA